MPGREFLTNCMDDPGRSLAARNTSNLSESRASPCVDSLQATRRNPARPPAAEQSDCGLRRSVRQPISPKQKQNRARATDGTGLCGPLSCMFRSVSFPPTDQRQSLLVTALEASCRPGPFPLLEERRARLGLGFFLGRSLVCLASSRVFAL